jgi:hypothetical protein
VTKDIDLDHPIEVGLNQPVLMGESRGGKFARIPDVQLLIRLLDGDDFGMLLFIEQQHLNDPDFPLRFFEIYTRLRANRPKGKVTGFVFYTGKENFARPDVYREFTNEIEVVLKFKTFFLPDYSLEELRKDPRPFAPYMYIGRLELDTGSDHSAREDAARHIEKYLAELKLSPEEEINCRHFTYMLFRLYDKDIDPRLSKEFRMIRKQSDSRAMLGIGMEIGWDEGRCEGWKEGREEGRVEGQAEKAKEIAKKLLAANMPEHLIVQACGLSEEEILSLRDGLSS